MTHSFSRAAVIALQKQSADDEPGYDDLRDIGVRAELLELTPLPDGTLKITTRIGSRVVIRAFTSDANSFQVEFAEIDDDAAGDAPDLVLRAVMRFERYADVRNVRMPENWSFGQARNPGAIADTIAAKLLLPMNEKYQLLATLDPIKRLERVEALLDLRARPVSATLQATLRRALNHAAERRHRYVTLEHLLLALIDDDSAAAVLRACRAGQTELKAKITAYLDTELGEITTDDGQDPQPTAAQLRVADRAALGSQELGYPFVTGANMLLGLFAETRSRAARLLAEHGVTLVRAAKAVAKGAGKDEA